MDPFELGFKKENSGGLLVAPFFLNGVCTRRCSMHTWYYTRVSLRHELRVGCQLDRLDVDLPISFSTVLQQCPLLAAVSGVVEVSVKKNW